MDTQCCVCGTKTWTLIGAGKKHVLISQMVFFAISNSRQKLDGEWNADIKKELYILNLNEKVYE